MLYKFRQKLDSWPKPFIRSYILKNLMGKEDEAFYSAVKRALQERSLISIRRGLYQISGRLVHSYELAHELHSPSYISFESALSYHGWIPEAVYTTTSACLKRSIEIATPLGLFSYNVVPTEEFYLGVDRKSNEATFFIASPWRAIADLIYSQLRNWKNFQELSEDLRIEIEDLQSSDMNMLEALSINYPNKRVKRALKHLLEAE